MYVLNWSLVIIIGFAYNFVCGLQFFTNETYYHHSATHSVWRNLQSFSGHENDHLWP